MANTMGTTHYAHAPQQNFHYGYMPPPSPPMDETTKCSLPSISNLLGLADQGSPTSETSAQSQQQCMDRPWWNAGCPETDGYTPAQACKPDTRPNSSHYGNPAMLRTTLPPSPPMSSDASFEGFNSPSTRSVSQVPSNPNYYFEAAPPLHMEADARQMTSAAAVPRVPVQASAYQPQYAGPAYISQPAMTTYYPPMQAAAPPQSQLSSIYYQRPLPHVSDYCQFVAKHVVSNTVSTGIPSTATRVGHTCSVGRRQPLAAPPLYRPILDVILPSEPGPVHLPDVQQGVFTAQLSPDPQPLAHGREAVQVPLPRLRQSVQRTEQHETTRAWLPQL